MNKKAVVSGAHGFIGSHLVKALQAKDIEVSAVPRNSLYSIGDLQDFFDSINPDYIFALHAYGNMHHQIDTDEIVRANIMGTYNMLKASKNNKYKAFINVSSSSVELDHQTIYSATKAAGEYLCKAFADEYGKPISSMRPFSVYGIGEPNYRFIPRVFESCLKGYKIPLAPDAVHDWIYVDDIVKSLIIAAGASLHTGLIVDLGTGVGTTNKKIVAMIEQLTGRKATILERKDLRSFDNKQWVASKENSLRKTSIDEGLRLIYEWYTNQGKEE